MWRGFKYEVFENCWATVPHSSEWNIRILQNSCDISRKSFLFLCFLLFYYSCHNFPLSFCRPSPPLSHSHSLPHCPCPTVIHTCSLTSPFPFPPLSPSLLVAVTLFLASDSILLVCCVHYRRDYMIFVFHLAYFT